MPLATPAIKVNSVRTHGGETVEVRLVGNNYDEAAAEAKRLESEEGLAMIHPFDDELVIAGQGTIGEFTGMLKGELAAFLIQTLTFFLYEIHQQSKY